MSIHSCGLGKDGARHIIEANDDDEALDPRGAAAFLGIALPTLWRQVEARQLPLPFYPAPRCPRWHKSELRRAVAALRMAPREAMERRRQRQLARLAEETTG
jgi:predicted DNA-binding transcriptional regulator AlpA